MAYFQPLGGAFMTYQTCSTATFHQISLPEGTFPITNELHCLDVKEIIKRKVYRGLMEDVSLASLSGVTKNN